MNLLTLIVIVGVLSLECNQSSGRQLKEYNIRFDTIKKLVRNNSYYEHQVANCNNSIFLFTKIATSDDDIGYRIPQLVFSRLTQYLDIKKNIIYCVIRTYRNQSINYNHSRIDGVYNLGSNETSNAVMFSRVVICKKQKEMSFWERSTTFWSRNICFKTIQ